MLAKVDIQKFNTLIETNEFINSKDTGLNSLLARILESSARVCDADASALLLVNKETRELRFEICPDGAGAEIKRHAVKMGEGIAGWVALHNTSIVVNDAGHDEKFRGDVLHEFNYPCGAVLAAPMRARDECLGVMELFNKKGGEPFNGEDQIWLDIFAAQAGTAVVNAGNIEKARGQIRQLFCDKISSPAESGAAVTAKSAVIREKLELVDEVAGTDSAVLILGERGAGAEVFAEQIYLKSRRRGKNFVKINCAAVPEELLESELFGHVKGAFDGADAGRYGIFEIADGGTVFLDEVCDLSPALQAKLLRVLQEKTFEKAGSGVSIPADVRILAAATRDIGKQVEKGEFLSDLYYRLNVFPLLLPPLRQRPEDIPDMAGIFLQKFMREMNKSLDGFSERAMETILSYSWPGNIRELEDCVERACLTAKGGKIEAEDLFFTTAAFQAARSDGDNSAGVGAAGSKKLKAAENVFRTGYIKQVLAEHNWNQTETAKVLGIQRTYLSRLIKELEISNHKEQ